MRTRVPESEVEDGRDLGVFPTIGRGGGTIVLLNVLRRRLPHSWRYVYRLKSGIG